MLITRAIVSFTLKSGENIFDDIKFTLSRIPEISDYLVMEAKIENNRLFLKLGIDDTNIQPEVNTN
jgi:hypothetical protein